MPAWAMGKSSLKTAYQSQLPQHTLVNMKQLQQQDYIVASGVLKQIKTQDLLEDTGNSTKAEEHNTEKYCKARWMAEELKMLGTSRDKVLAVWEVPFTTDALKALL